MESNPTRFMTVDGETDDEFLSSALFPYRQWRWYDGFEE